LTSLHQVFVLMGPGILLAFLMNYLAGFVEKRSYSLMGRKVYLVLFGWLGIMVHEFGHAFFCIIFRHKINKVKLFDPDSESGSLGYVNHSYNPNSLYQLIGNFFIGIGPIAFAFIVIYCLSRYLLRSDIFQSIELFESPSAVVGTSTDYLEALTSMWKGVMMLCVSLFAAENFTDWRFYLFLYIVFCIGSSITLSPADIKGAGRGFGAFIVILFLLNLATLWIVGNNLTEVFRSLAHYYSLFYTTMLFAIALNIMASFVMVMIPISSRAVTAVSARFSRRDP